MTHSETYIVIVVLHFPTYERFIFNYVNWATKRRIPRATIPMRKAIDLN